MTIQLDERPDIELIEAPEDSTRPLVAHYYCIQCNSGRRKTAGARARCGYVWPGPKVKWRWRPGAGEQICIVCEDMDRWPCPRCGW